MESKLKNIHPSTAQSGSGIPKYHPNTKIMRKTIRTFLAPRLILLILALTFTSNLFAQIPGTNIPPREDDHFQRDLVVSRIDMNEKMNQPMVASEDAAMYGGNKYGETQGLIRALMNGLQSGKYLAYDADTIRKSLTFDDVVGVYKQVNGMEEPDEFDDPDMETDSLGFEEDDLDTPDWDDESFPEPGGAGWDASEGMDLGPFESVIELIENRIFDKNRSDLVHDVQYLRLVWVDPGETLPDKNFICFKFSDVLDVLEDTQWKNKFNDAECRNMREVIEERMFNSFVINVSGRGVRTLEQSDYRRNQLLEFEHNLWNY